MPLVTDAQVRNHLRIDEGEDVSVYVAAAERIAADHFLNCEIYADQAALDSANDPTGIIANPAIQAGILLIVGDLYRDRESTKQGVYTPSSTGVERVLSPYRAGMGV